MSRETDSSSSGPQGGRGGSAYPPGTDPYGTAEEGAGPDPNANPSDKPDSATPSDEPRTETTLTTRIRINIPGSRPIPPVVMRKTVTGNENADVAPESAAERTDGAGTLPPPPPVTPASPVAPAAPAAPADGAGDQGGTDSGEAAQETSSWFAPRKSPKATPSSGGAAGAAAGAAGVAGAGAAAGAPSDDTAGGRGGLPYFSDSPANSGTPDARPDAYDPGSPAAGHPGHPETPADGFPRSAIHNLMDGSDGAGGAPGTGPGGAPAGPTTGPHHGEMPFGAPHSGPFAEPQGGPYAEPQSGPAAGPQSGLSAMGTDAGTGTGPQQHVESPPYAGPYAQEPAASSTLGLGAGTAPFAPGGAGEDLLQGGPGSPSATGADRVTSDTLGVPRVPSPGGPAGSPAGTPSGPAGDTGAGAPAAPSSSGQSSGGAGGGRSKLMLAGAGLVGLLGVAYGAGLLLDHADVPTGTTVLGVDIGNTTRHEAVNKLDTALGSNRTKAFTVSAAGHDTQLRPSVAGLTLDTEETVRKAAGRDYNPVSVIGSLFGAGREAQPAIKVDKEKMKSALTRISRQSGGSAPQDGRVKFVSGKAVAVPGRAHKGIDPERAGAALEKAYRDRAVTGRNSPVALPVSMQQPEVGKPQLDKALQEFGNPAMSGLVTVKAGNASIKFSPQKSLPKFLAMKPVNGKLMDTYNLPALQQLYGTTFAGVKITRGTGARTPVMPQDVVSALRPALKQTDPAKRVAVIPLNPS